MEDIEDINTELVTVGLRQFLYHLQHTRILLQSEIKHEKNIIFCFPNFLDMFVVMSTRLSGPPPVQPPSTYQTNYPLFPMHYTQTYINKSFVILQFFMPVYPIMGDYSLECFRCVGVSTIGLNKKH